MTARVWFHGLGVLGGSVPSPSAVVKHLKIITAQTPFRLNSRESPRLEGDTASSSGKKGISCGVDYSGIVGKTVPLMMKRSRPYGGYFCGP